VLLEPIIYDKKGVGLGSVGGGGGGSVGGGVWKTGTIVVPIYKKER